MIVIKKTNWMYDLIANGTFVTEFTRADLSYITNLCPFVRLFFIELFKHIAIFSSILVGPILGSILLPFLLYGKLFGSWIAIQGGGMWALFTVVWMICGSICYVIALFMIHDWLDNPLVKIWNHTIVLAINRIIPVPKVDPTPNIFVEYIRAMHDRVCPSIEIVE